MPLRLSAVSARWRKVAATAGPMLTPVSNSSAAMRGAALGDLVEARPQPVEPAVDRRRFVARQLAHRAGIAVGARDRLGDPEAGRPALVGRMVDIAALALDQRLDQPIDIGIRVLAFELSRAMNSKSREYNQTG